MGAGRTSERSGAAGAISWEEWKPRSPRTRFDPIGCRRRASARPRALCRRSGDDAATLLVRSLFEAAGHRTAEELTAEIQAMPRTSPSRPSTGTWRSSSASA